MRTILAWLLMFVAPLAATAQVTSSGDAPPIEVSHCLVGAHQDIGMRGPLINAGLLVTFKSHASQTFKRLVWRARYGNGWIDFNDKGTFSPEAEITNGLWIRNRAFAGPPLPFEEYENGDVASECTLVLAESKDGTVWTKRAPTDPAFYIPTPFQGENIASKPAFHRTINWQDGTQPGFQGLQPLDYPPIQVESCAVGARYNIPSGEHNLNALLIVRFRVTGPEKYGRIIWRARFGNGWVDFDDRGEFSPNISIENALYIRGPLSGLRPYLNNGSPADCAVMYAETKDLKKWNRIPPNTDLTYLPDPLGDEDSKFDSPFDPFAAWQDGEFRGTP